MLSVTSSTSTDAIILIAVLIYTIYKYFTWNFNYWQRKGVYFVKPIPIFGNFTDVVLVRSSIGKLLSDFYAQVNEKYFGIWAFGTPHLVVKDTELIKNILVKDFNYFYDRTVLSDESVDPLASKVIFILKNPEWKTMRSKLSPIFTSGKIKNMIPLMNDAANELKMYLSKYVAKNEPSLDAKEVCAKFTTDVVTSCAFGVSAQSFRHEKAAFREIGRKMFDFKIMTAIRAVSYFFIPTMVKIFRITFFEPSVNEFCREAFWETIKERKRTGARRNDLIDIIIDMMKIEKFDGFKFEGDRVVAQALQFFAAGFETTSSTIAFTLYEMCLNQKLQAKLKKEVDEAMNEFGGVTYDSIMNMKYLDKVVKETLRKYPVLPFLDRRCMKDYKVPNSDLTIDKGTPIYISVYGLHYDQKYFPEPDKYDPERFTEENIKTRPPFSYIPFGDGPHNCIGERFGLIASKLGIIQIISSFHVERSADTPVPIIYDPRTFVLQSRTGIPMKFTSYDKRISSAA